MWVKLDDGYFRHRKARAAGKDGRALFIAGLAWSNANRTDGHIAETDLAIVAAEADVNPKRTAAVLVKVGHWEPVEGGWAIHDYHDYNPSAEKVEAIRQARAEAGRKGGAKPKPKQPGSKLLSNGGAKTEPRIPSPNSSNSLHHQTSDGAKPDDDDDDRIIEALEVIAAARTARLQTPPRNPSAYRRSTVARLDAEWRPKLAGMLAALPDATAGQLAAWVLDQDDPPPDAGVPASPCPPRPCSDPACARCDGEGVIFDADGAVVDRCWAEPSQLAPPSIGEWAPEPIGART